MPTHTCTESDRLKRMESRLISLDEGLRGNGKPGLFTEFAVLRRTVGAIVGLMIIIITAVVNLIVKAW